MSAGLEPVLGHTEKPCIALYNRQFTTIVKIGIMKLIPVLLARTFSPIRANKTAFNRIIFHFNIRGKLSIIRYDK